MAIRCVLLACFASLHIAATDSSTLTSNAPSTTYETKASPSAIDSIYRELASRRRLQIARLHDYAIVGRFPRNLDFPGQLVPYFVDKCGTACAVGHLIRLDGHSGLVASIASTRNHVRIEDVTQGPLVNWIRGSGLTRAECALIQPSYSTIEDYRPTREWQNEQDRLRKHFAEVERTLEVQTQRSLGEALIEKLRSERESGAESASNNSSELIEALNSREPNVRIAAAHLLAEMSAENCPRGRRIEALRANLADAEPSVRFWTAVALERLAELPERSRYRTPTAGETEIHRLTLPIFLKLLQDGPDEFRLPSLLQLADLAPEAIGSNMQLRIVPQIRRELVQACDDRDPAVKQAARQVLQSWRWQRVAYESQRMRRHYLADSADLESRAAEALLLERPFAVPVDAVDRLRRLQLPFDEVGGPTYFLTAMSRRRPPMAANEDEARQIVDADLRAMFGDAMKGDHSPSWNIDSVYGDARQLYYFVRIRRTDGRYHSIIRYLLPRSKMFASIRTRDGEWLDTKHGSAQSIWPAAPPSTIRPSEGNQIHLGDAARSNLLDFTTTCDICASFLTHYARNFIDREASESKGNFIWTGRMANLRRFQPRFQEQGGGGSSVYGGGGWDFHRLTMSCDRSTGALTLNVDPIPFPLIQLSKEALDPQWTVDELRYMGWKPLSQTDFFGERLLPREYHEAFEDFNANADRYSMQRFHSQLYRRWSQDKSLPPPALMVALMYDQAGNRETALQSVTNMGSEVERDPAALADIARWELQVGEVESARKHALAARKLWPTHPVAANVLRQIDAADSAP
ncbi:MAG: HEAT repeat domain-containing protein [Pirellulales bacterium]